MTDQLEWLKAQLTELRDFLSETSGKLAAAASAVAGVLAFVSTDPSVALIASEFLPDILRFPLILLLIVVTYILPHWAKKRDNTNDPEK